MKRYLVTRNIVWFRKKSIVENFDYICLTKITVQEKANITENRKEQTEILKAMSFDFAIWKSWAALVTHHNLVLKWSQQTQDTIFCQHGAMWHVRFGMEIKCHDASRERNGYFRAIPSFSPRIKCIKVTIIDNLFESEWSNPILMTNKWESFGWMLSLD